MPGTTPLTRCPVVPVVVIDDAAQALPLGRALLAGGIDVVEITLRTSAGLDAIRALRALPDLQVCAGSVLVPDQVDQVVDAGAEFVVSPGLSRGVLERSRALGVPALPGVATASDLMVAVELGLTEVKFFPAGLLGGPAAIRALAAPFTGVSFMPSGGVNQDNMAEYLALPAVPAVSGSWMVEPALLAAGRWDDVTERSAAAIERAAKA
ncbi:bifunctional 4-hydroxy-2-oxoglutarate aldolase/2-dehydro-3-deoxy-phosphogluconate aldolase [Streptomyces millisiae]|uniref:2-dehydro-3-deoxy-phosphogluconate aldolase n=1 Tax=Streptomyces millisiae TaxID=3075542 RepID=A0ABU2LJL8_9ACTN|nr:bifunctional 4-hydroxy-2-oxoglutarate aldolase/2-dehydro-3-deoxy-phosphogluconate aldolase [Streptomyces sp. DSM 44918]MDT0317781.1 bifunctional 4-hydroxy-2-oxoglutarate aldolase/2-dehydro-3-deoxy-phosphogluconate aldolase [Streptomyces sp. DSM 44918]